MKIRLTYILPIIFALYSYGTSAQDMKRGYCVESTESYPRHLYVKTNIVNWLMAISNFSLEADLSQHWSVTLPVSFSAWNYFSSTVKFRTLSFYPEIRYWTSEHQDGWFAGVHYGIAWYNFAIGKKYRTQDKGGHTPAIGAGVAAGYRLPIHKNNRWQLEFSLGLGIYRLHHDKFLNTHNGPWVRRERKIYFGPDHLSISLAYMIDLKKSK